MSASLGRILAAIPDFSLAVYFLSAWLVPERLADNAATNIVLLFLMEFIILHSSIFMGMALLGKHGKIAKLRGLTFFGAFYTLFVGGWSVAFRTVRPLLFFWLLTFNKILGVMLERPIGEGAKALMHRTWTASLVLYVFCAFATVFVPVHNFGLAEVDTGVSGLWAQHPERVAAFGGLYFFLLAISQLFDHRWMKGARWR